MLIIVYLLVILLGFLIPVLVAIYTIYQFISDFKGAPYVPTSVKIVAQILKEANLKKGQIFLELGSGDGRIVRTAVKNYQVNGLGVDINLPLIFYSRVAAKLQKLEKIKFLRQDLFKTNLKKTDVLFLFLLPKTLKKIAPKILTECKKNTLIISHGFRLEGLEKYLVKKTDRKYFPTYYYKIK